MNENHDLYDFFRFITVADKKNNQIKSIRSN